jgi:nitroreductase
MVTASTVPVLTVQEAAERRRSIRQYQQAAVPSSDLEEILRITSLAPSSFNLQPWRFVIVHTPEVKAQLAAAANHQRQVISASTVIVLYTDVADALADVDAVLHPQFEDAKRERTRSAAVRYFASKDIDEREAWGAAQGYIALGFLLLAAEAHGYQTSPMLGFDAEAVKTQLRLPSHVRVPALVAIGVGTEDGLPHHRHPLERIVRWA